MFDDLTIAKDIRAYNAICVNGRFKCLFGRLCFLKKRAGSSKLKAHSDNVNMVDCRRDFCYDRKEYTQINDIIIVYLFGAEKMSTSNNEKQNGTKYAWHWRLGLFIICIPAAVIILLCLLGDLYNSGVGDVFDLCMDVVGSLICVLLYYGCMSVKEMQLTQARTFLVTLFLNALSLMFDTMIWALDGHPSLRLALMLVSILFYVTGMFLFYQFWRYALGVLCPDVLPNSPSAKELPVEASRPPAANRLDMILRLLLIPGVLLCISNMFIPVLFRVTEDGVFQKASGYGLGYIYMLCTIAALLLILFHGQVSKWQKLFTGLFALVPVTVLISTKNMPDVAIVYTTASITILLINCVLFTENIRMKELIIRVFSLLILCAMLICGPMLYTVSLQITSMVGYERAEGAFAQTARLLDKIGLDNLSDPENKDLYERTRQELRYKCMDFKLVNICVETIDTEHPNRTFIIAVAAEDEADEELKKTLGWPGASIWSEKSSLTRPELLADSGKVSKEYVEVNNDYGHSLIWFYPYRAENNKVVALIEADYEIKSQQIDAMYHTISNALPVLALYLITLMLLLAILDRSFVVPIHLISRHIESFLSGGKMNEESLSVWGGYEIGRLSESFDFMTGELKEYEEKLKRETAERERISVELNLAARIQANHLPSSFPAFPERKEFDIYAIMQPAKEVGGDFYDYYFVDEDHLALTVADVCGKGIPASLFMMLSKTMLQTTAQLGFSPAGVLEKVDEQLSKDNKDYMFVTVWLGILELSTGKLVYADAGHEKLLLRRDHRWEYLPKGEVRMPLGLRKTKKKVDPAHPICYMDKSVTLSPGDVLVQYSDGVTETINTDRKFFKEEGLLNAVNSAPSTEPEELLTHIHTKLEDYMGEAEQFDDITLFCARYNGSEVSNEI